MSFVPGLFHLEDTPVLTRIAQVVGVTAAAFACGQTASASYLLTPAILKSPAPLLAKQWEQTHYTAGRIAAPLVLASSAAFGYLASLEPADSTAFGLYTAAAILTPAMIPITLTVMRPLIQSLQRKVDSFALLARTSHGSQNENEKDTGVPADQTTHALVDQYANWNMLRAVIVGLGAVCGALAVVGRGDIQAISVEGLGISLGADRMGH